MSKEHLVSPTRENVLTVYRRIRRMILSGDLRGGQVISQVQLASEFDTSRGPVREAIRMLQQEGLIEAETNQQGRIMQFSPADLEQVCALLVLNGSMAISAGHTRFNKDDTRSIVRIIDRIEALSCAPVSPARTAHRIERRQLAFRKLLSVLCKYSGSYIVGLIGELLDRVAMLRQLYVLGGASPPYPLSDDFSDLRSAALNGDGLEIAHSIVQKISELSHKALEFADPHYRPDLLNAYVSAASAGLGARSEDAGADCNGETSLQMATMTITVRGLPGSKIACEIVQN
jgi:DNA-binding GntR family transcriptional regulator